MYVTRYHLWDQTLYKYRTLATFGLWLGYIFHQSKHEYHNANQWVLLVFIQMVKFKSWGASENAFHSLSVGSRNSPLKWIANMRTKYYRTVRKCYCFYLLWQYYYYWFAHLQQKCFFCKWLWMWHISSGKSIYLNSF